MWLNLTPFLKKDLKKELQRRIDFHGKRPIGYQGLEVDKKAVEYYMALMKDIDEKIRVEDGIE
jgi:hypothetical protein